MIFMNVGLVNGVCQLEICGDIGNDEVSLEDFLSQGLSIDRDVPSPPAGFIYHGQSCCVVTSHVPDDFCGDGLMNQNPKVSCCLERGTQSIKLCLS